MMLIPGVWPTNDQNDTRYTAPATSHANTPTASAGTVAPLGNTTDATNATSAEAAMNARFKTPTSSANATARVNAPAQSVGSTRRRRPKIRRTIRSIPSSIRLATLPISRRMSSRNPMPWEVIAANLGGLRDPLDQLLGLVASEDALPELVDELAVDRLRHRTLDGRAVECAAHRLLDRGALQDADDRTLDGRALQRRDDRLLGGNLDSPIDAGDLSHAPRTAGAAPEQSGWERHSSPTLRRADP